jgi:hypothetical protein
MERSNSPRRSTLPSRQHLRRNAGTYCLSAGCLGPPTGPGKALLTAPDHPRAIFHRAIERRNLPVAETTLRGLGRPILAELLELTILIAEREPRRHARVPARWLLRYLEVRDAATIDDAALARQREKVVYPTRRAPKNGRREGSRRPPGRVPSVRTRHR